MHVPVCTRSSIFGAAPAAIPTHTLRNDRCIHVSIHNFTHSVACFPISIKTTGSIILSCVYCTAMLQQHLVHLYCRPPPTHPVLLSQPLSHTHTPLHTHHCTHTTAHTTSLTPRLAGAGPRPVRLCSRLSASAGGGLHPGGREVPAARPSTCPGAACTGTWVTGWGKGQAARGTTQHVHAFQMSVYLGFITAISHR